MAETSTKPASHQKPAAQTEQQKADAAKKAAEISKGATGNASTTPEVEKKPRSMKQFCASAEEATTEAASRTKGARRAWKGTGPDGTDYFLVAYNEDQACSLLWPKIGGKVEEIGKAPRAPRVAKPETVDDLLGQLKGITEEDRKKLMDKLAGLQTIPAAAPKS